MDALGQHETKRLLPVTAGNLRNNHLYVHKHYDFFPSDCIGPCRKRAKDEGAQIELWLEGLDQLIRTDIPRDAKTGKARGFLRDRRSVGRFYKHHKVKAGERLALERVTTRSYRLLMERGNGNGNHLELLSSSQASVWCALPGG
jgi:hypothetical protein